MALCICKCLNIRLLISGNVPKSATRVTDCEQRDSFFRELLVSCPSLDLTVEVAQPALTTIRHDGVWSVHVCVVCDTCTHATGPETHTLLNKATLTTREAVESLKCSPHFSPVFKLLVPEISTEEETKENVVANKPLSAPVGSVATLSKLLSRSLQSKLESIEESIRLFRDQKYAEYEQYRERANRDHMILASIVNKARQAERTERLPPSPPSPHEFRRRMSSFKGAKKLKQNLKNTRNTGSEEDSLDSEDIFDLESEQPGNGNNSDADDYDTDESGSRDEGIHIRGAGGVAVPGRSPRESIARSLPVDVPRFSAAVPISSRQIDDEEEPRDIAASIKALARSVHADVFGDLPRPRFSTQI